ncbi:MAG: hypothetical protein ACFFBP_09985 [Promethearchaeota archaeon]
MSSSKEIVKNTHEKLKISMKRKSRAQVISLFLNLLRRMEIEEITNSHFYNMIAETLSINPIYFMHKIYPQLRKKLEKLLDFQELKDLERYILKKISFLQGETFIYEFKGQLTQRIERTGSKIVLKNANIYFTNYRMIIHSNGINIVSTESEVRSHFKNDYLRKYYVNMILSRNFYHSRPCFGYEFPILELYDIEKTRTNVQYTFHQGGKKLYCELVPKFVFNLKGIDKILNDLNSDNIPLTKRKVPCISCGNNIKLKHQYCKHCGKKIQNEEYN